MTRICTVEGCDRAVHARGLCVNHYHNARSSGRLPIVSVRTCTIEGCDRLHAQRGLCQMHFSRYRRRGLPYPVPSREASTMAHLMANVVITPGPLDTDCWIAGYSIRGGYPSIRLRGYAGKRGCHIFAYETLVGPVPEGHHLHHLCEVPRCCNPAHLQPLTPADHSAAHRELDRLRSPVYAASDGAR